jgi:hypothetical protein
MLFVVLGALAMGGGQCSNSPGRCTVDEDCGSPFRRCDVDTGYCGCITEEGCADDEFCNALGACQVRSGCVTNEDCTQVAGDVCASQFCNVKSGQCTPNCGCDAEAGEECCSLDSHCAFGQICEPLNERCVPGCRGDGDCRIGEGCIGLALNVRVGQCAAGVCTGDALCGFGETCNLESGECLFDTRGPYCAGCSGGVASTDCGEPANYCLTDTTDPVGRSEFCGVDCNQNQPCPFGYDCRSVIIIPPSAPFCSAEACIIERGQAQGRCSQNTNVTCTVSEDCPIGLPGGTCRQNRPLGNCINNQTQECDRDADCCADPASCASGSCVKQQCRSGQEGAAFGHCTCTRDLDCPRDQCKGADGSNPNNPLSGHCELSGHRCFDDLDCDVIGCVNGGCRIGRNCAPANDRACRELGAQR